MCDRPALTYSFGVLEGADLPEGATINAQTVKEHGMASESSEVAGEIRAEQRYARGLEGLVAGDTAVSDIDGSRGRLFYRGYPIGELVREGSFAQVAHLLWADEWLEEAHLPCAPLADSILAALRDLPEGAHISGPALLEQPDTALTLGDYLDSNGYSEQFVDYYILPMGSAIWSTTAPFGPAVCQRRPVGLCQISAPPSRVRCTMASSFSWVAE